VACQRRYVTFATFEFILEGDKPDRKRNTRRQNGCLRYSAFSEIRCHLLPDWRQLPAKTVNCSVASENMPHS